jgi:hypothetical protein
MFTGHVTVRGEGGGGGCGPVKTVTVNTAEVFPSGFRTVSLNGPAVDRTTLHVNFELVTFKAVPADGFIPTTKLEPVTVSVCAVALAIGAGETPVTCGGGAAITMLAQFTLKATTAANIIHFMSFTFMVSVWRVTQRQR